MSKKVYGICSVSYCKKDATLKGLMLCTNHTARYRSGSPTWNERSQYEKSERERFWEKVDKSGGIPEYAPHLGECWRWTGSLTKTPIGNYGGFRSIEIGLGGGTTGAHRVSYFYETGTRSNRENHIDHLCRNTICVNPKHLELVTSSENVRRGMGPTAINARKTHCVNGHEFTPDNTGDNCGRRSCKECHRIVSARWARSRAKGRKLKYLDGDILMVFDLRNSGKTMQEIADITGISSGYVFKVLSGGSKRANELLNNG